MNKGAANAGLIWAVVAIMVVAIGAFLIFANIDEDENDTTDPTETEEITEEGAPERQNIVEVADANPQFTTLVAAIQQADLVGTLSEEGPYTVFAPTNDGFNTTAEEQDATVEELLARDDLRDILTYHVVEGEILEIDLLEQDGQQLETLHGQMLEITVENNEVFVNGVQIVATDIVAGNGVIHAIDAVLLPTEE